ncbi:hypothetical protein [Microbispora sp. NPDC049125]|uniref:hypothetical protein n=1 Tax=Microbispora sp. NPDC049125 TaxID=3154929 RepID=UPI00346507A0
MSVFEAHPEATEVVVANLPGGSTLRVHHPSGPRDYTHNVWDEFPDLPFIPVVPGDREAIGWGCYLSEFGSLRGVRNGHIPRNREAWHAAAKVLRGGGVVYVRYELQDYYGKPTWTATGVRS